MSKIKGKFIEDLAIETNHLADGSVTEEKLHSDLATKIENKADATALDNYYDKSETDALLLDKANVTDLADYIAKDDVDDATLELGDNDVLQVKDGGIDTDQLADGAVTGAKLHTDVVNSIDENTSGLVKSRKDANQKFFGGGDVSVILNSGPMSDGYTIANGTVSVQGNEDGTETRQRSQPYIANFSGTVENIDLFCYISTAAFPNISEGYVYLELYNADNNGLPTGSALAISSHIDYTLLPVGNPGAVQFTFETPVEITKDNVYAIVPVVALTASLSNYSRLLISSDSNNGYSEFPSGATFDNGSSWSPGADHAFNFQFHIVLDSPISSLSFTEDINVARPGLALEDNVIEAPVSPIALNDGELLYVIPNEDDQGSALTLTAATSETLPDNALVLAYRDGEDIVVDGIRLEPDQSAKLGQAPAAEMIDAYTKSETDALLLDKANVTDLADYIKAAVDDATLEIDTEVLQVKDGGIDTAQLADEGVTEAKLSLDVQSKLASVGTGDAADITYDNQTSGLTADDVQDAIDEVVVMVKSLPDPIVYKGTYDADNNIPALSNADEGVTGHLYQVTVDGTQDFGAGPIEFHAGDKVVNNGSEWQKWDMTDAVTSVNGQTGAVVLDTDDISEGSTNLYFTDTRAKTAAVVNSLAGSETDQAPSVSAVNDALSNLPSPPSNVKETFVLNSTDISNEYIDLSDLATANSVQIMIRGAGAIMEGASYDYTVSEVGGVTRITFTAALMNELAENDVVQVTYMK